MPKIVDERGREIKLSTRQKNEIYHEAKRLREDINGSRLTERQHWNPTEQNVREMTKREMSPEMTRKMQEYRQRMQAIGADPKDLNLPLYRGSRVTTQK